MSSSVALASTVLEKSDRLRYSAIKITTWLRINLRSVGPHAKQATSWRSGLLRMDWGNVVHLQFLWGDPTARGQST